MLGGKGGKIGNFVNNGNNIFFKSSGHYRSNVAFVLIDIVDFFADFAEVFPVCQTVNGFADHAQTVKKSGGIVLVEIGEYRHGQRIFFAAGQPVAVIGNFLRGGSHQKVQFFVPQAVRSIKHHCPGRHGKNRPQHGIFGFIGGTGHHLVGIDFRISDKRFQLFGLQTVKGAELVVPVAADAAFPDFGIKISVHIEIVSEFGQILSGGGSLPGTEIGVQAFNLLNGRFGGLGFDKNAV